MNKKRWDSGQKISYQKKEKRKRKELKTEAPFTGGKRSRIYLHFVVEGGGKKEGDLLLHGGPRKRGPRSAFPRCGRWPGGPEKGKGGGGKSIAILLGGLPFVLNLLSKSFSREREGEGGAPGGKEEKEAEGTFRICLMIFLLSQGERNRAGGAALQRHHL